MKNILLILFFIPFLVKAQTAPPIVQGSKLYQFKNGIKIDSALFVPRRDTTNSDVTMLAPGMIQWNPTTQRFNGRDSIKWVTFMTSLTGEVIDSAYRSNDTLFFRYASGGELVVKMDYYTKSESDTLFLTKRPSQIFPYDSAYIAPPSDLFAGNSNGLEFLNMGNTIRSSVAFERTPMGIVRNNWSLLLTNNMIYDSTAQGWNAWNTNYPLSCLESGWEGVTFHYVPHGYANFTAYPHEGLQLRGGIDGIPALESDSQYIQIKTTVVGRYDTAFDAGNTAYAWGYSRRPFNWFFSEYPTRQLQTYNGTGNIYSMFSQYTNSTTSAPITAFERSRGTFASKTAVQSGDTLGNVNWYSYDGGSFLNTARIYARATAIASSNNAATALTLQASNGASAAGNMTITSGGNVGVNTNTPQSVLHLVRQDFGGVVYIDRYNNTGTELAPGVFGIAARGTVASPAAVQDNDPLMVMGAGGYDGSIMDRDSRGSVSISADGNWSTSNKPTRYDVKLTHTIDDMGVVFGIDKDGNTGIGGEEDGTHKLYVHGNIRASANAYASGGYDLLTRNQTSGAFETISNTTFAPASGSPNYAPASSSPSYVNVQTSVNQTGGFRMSQTSYLIGTATTAFNIGQTGATSTNTAGINLDGVNGDFAGLDYLELRQAQDGTARLRNNNSGGNLVLGAGGSSSANITLTAGNVTTLGGAFQAPITSVSGNATLTSSHFTIEVSNTGSATITLPSVSTTAGRIYVIKKLSAGGNDVIIDGAGADQIDGAATKTLTLQYSAIIIQSDGIEWRIIGAYATGITL